MKHFIAILMVFVLCLGTAYAAEWPEGTSPAKPYKGVREADLDKIMGHMLEYPKVGDPAELYCDTLYIYLPREDVALGENTMKVLDENGEYISVSFNDADHVRLVPLDEETLSDLMWGSGVCIEILLPVSLGHRLSPFSGRGALSRQTRCRSPGWCGRNPRRPRPR